jgi:flagellar biosynthesis regulator FlbT
MKSFFIFLTVMLFVGTSKAQNAADSVRQTINQLFEGMKNSNALLIQSSFADSAVLQTISHNKDGKTIVLNETVRAFASSVSKLIKGDADERIVFDVIKIDESLAIVWAPYKFYYKGNFNHCGVNSFQLVKLNGEWKIQYLIDTRHKNNCVGQ